MQLSSYQKLFPSANEFLKDLIVAKKIEIKTIKRKKLNAKSARFFLTRKKILRKEKVGLSNF